MAQLARGVGTSGAITATVDGLPFRLALPRLAGAMLARVDGRARLRDIHAALRERDARLDEQAFLSQFAQAFESLHALGKLMLRR